MSNFYFNNVFELFGLNRKDIKKIINKHFKENADVLIGVDDPEVNQLVDVLVDAFTEVIKTNNERFSVDIKKYIEKYLEEKNILKD